MKQSFVLLVSAFIILTGCAEKPSPVPAVSLLELSDLSIAIRLPPGLESISAEDMAQIQKAAADFSPIPPFTDYPCYEFVNPHTGSALVISKLNFIKVETSEQGPVSVVDEYINSLEIYYQADSIAVNETIKDDYKLSIMNFLYEPQGETAYLTKVVYYRFPHHYILFDFYYDSQKITAEEIQGFEEMLLSLQSL